MLEMSFAVFTPLLIVSVAIGLLLAIVWTARRWLDRGNRRSPLTKDLLRGPGHKLRERIDDLGWDFASYLAIAPLIPLLVYATYLQQRLVGRTVSAPWAAIYVTFSIGAVIFVGYRMIEIMRDLRRYRLGFEAEVAAAEELNRLMQQHYNVFHDVPGDGPFNVDHVIVGPTGVFAIETKGRMKRTDRSDNDGHVVRSNGVELEFPGWRDRKPIEQAQRNAKWLAKWLSSSVGEKLYAQPIVLLPGWWIELKAPSGVPVMNPGQVKAYLRQFDGDSLSEKQIAQIVHQLDARCRTVESKVGGSRKKAS